MRLDRIIERAGRLIALCLLTLIGLATVGYIYGGIWILAAIW